VVTVVGRAFYDIDHSGSNSENNRRNYNEAIAVWEIHPVMRLAVGPGAPEPTAASFAPPPAISETPVASPQPNVPGEQFVTLTRPVPVQIPYGTTVLQPGTRLPILSREAQTVDVRYLDARYTIPISATDLR
jgi:hypothetical protein